MLKKFRLKKTIHQFLPIDSRILVKKFLSNWEPTVAIFIESEIWPEMLRILKIRKIKTFLLKIYSYKNDINYYLSVVKY